MKPTAHKHHWYFYVGIVLLVIILLLVGLVGWLTATEWKPADVEDAAIQAADSSRQEVLRPGEAVKVLTWNTGYAGLGEEADFVLDGGKTSNPESEEVVNKNMMGIEALISQADADILMLQEVDTNSARTYDKNQWTAYHSTLQFYDSAFAFNYRCHFVPFPPTDPIARVNSGVATFSRYGLEGATRQSLPVPFTWPMRIANLKRCLLVSRVPILDSDRELVMVNLHLEAYDDGEGKIAQTRQLVSLLEEEYEKGHYVIAGGDFNQVFPGAKHEVKETSAWVPGRLNDLENGWNYLFDDSTPTCRLLNQPLDLNDPLTQFYTIDGFIVSPNVEVTSVKTLDAGFTYSDHNPVELQVKLK